MDLKEIGMSTRNWIDSAQDRDYWRALENVVLNLRGEAMHRYIKRSRSSRLFIYFCISS